MKTVSLLYISITALWVFSACGKKNNNEVADVISLEQKALTVFLDSVAYKPIDGQNNSDSSDIVAVLPGVPIDSIWEYKGMFLGYNLSISNYASELSKPYVDTLSFISNQEFYSDSAKQEIVGYWQYQKEHLLTDTIKVKLQTPDSLKKDFFKNYISRKQSNGLFLQVYKKISSSQTEMVQIKVFMYKEEYQDYVSFKFYFFQNKKTGSCFWYFS